MLVEFDPRDAQRTLTRAKARLKAAQARARRTLAALTSQERSATWGVTAAVGTMQTANTTVHETQILTKADPAAAAGVEHARQQVAQAENQVLRAVQIQIRTAQAAVDRDKDLVASGLIAVDTLMTDRKTLAAAQAEAEMARAAIRDMQSYVVPTPEGAMRAGGAEGVGRAEQRLAAAQAAASGAHAAVDAAKRVVDRDAALLADGAIAANQLKSDNTAYAAARARAEAALAAVGQAQAQLAAAHAPRRQTTISHQIVIVNTERAAQAETLARRAQAAIRQAQRRAQELAAAQTAVVDAEGAVRTAELNLHQTLIRAPVNGWVVNRLVRPGQTVRSAQPLMAISIEASKNWIIANVPPVQLGRVRVGDLVRMTIAAYAQRAFRGRVIRIGGADQAWAAFPWNSHAGSAANARLIPIEIAFAAADAQHPMPAGLRARVIIDTRYSSASAEATDVYAVPEDTASRTQVSSPPLGAGRVPPRVPGPGDATARELAQIRDEEQRTLAQLADESTQIQAIIIGSGSDHAVSGYAGPEPVPAGLAAAPDPRLLGGDTAHPGRTTGGRMSGPIRLSGGLLWPISGDITSGYGWRVHPIFHTPEFHTGLDIAAPYGAPVEAAADGTVIFTGWMPANGNILILDHGNGLSTTYSHLSSFDVGVGERVLRGQIIARIGSTGWSTGPHLFFEVRENGRPIDPVLP